MTKVSTLAIPAGTGGCAWSQMYVLVLFDCHWLSCVFGMCVCACALCEWTWTTVCAFAFACFVWVKFTTCSWNELYNIFQHLVTPNGYTVPMIVAIGNHDGGGYGLYAIFFSSFLFICLCSLLSKLLLPLLLFIIIFYYHYYKPQFKGVNGQHFLMGETKRGVEPLYHSLLSGVLRFNFHHSLL